MIQEMDLSVIQVLKSNLYDYHDAYIIQQNIILLSWQFIKLKQHAETFQQFQLLLIMMLQNQVKSILKTRIIAILLKYLSDFQRSLKKPLINCKVELKLKWRNYFILSVPDNENDNPNAHSNNFTFIFKDTNLYLTIITLSAKDNQKLSKLLSKGFERSVY